MVGLFSFNKPFLNPTLFPFCVPTPHPASANKGISYCSHRNAPSLHHNFLQPSQNLSPGSAWRLSHSWTAHRTAGGELSKMLKSQPAGSWVSSAPPSLTNLCRECRREWGIPKLEQCSVSPGLSHYKFQLQAFVLKSLIFMVCLLIWANKALGRSNSLLTFRRVTLHPDSTI